MKHAVLKILCKRVQQYYMTRFTAVYIAVHASHCAALMKILCPKKIFQVKARINTLSIEPLSPYIPRCQRILKLIYLQTIWCRSSKMGPKKDDLFYYWWIKPVWPSEGPLTRTERGRQAEEWHRRDIKTQNRRMKKEVGRSVGWALWRATKLKNNYFTRGATGSVKVEGALVLKLLVKKEKGILMVPFL